MSDNYNLSLGHILGIAGGSLAVGLALGYLFFGNSKTKRVAKGVKALASGGLCLCLHFLQFILAFVSDANRSSIWPDRYKMVLVVRNDLSMGTSFPSSSVEVN